MPRKIENSIKSHYHQATTTIARCIRILRQDGKIIALTDHDVDLTIDEITYQSAAGYTPTAIHTSDQLSTNNIDIEGILSIAGINRSEIEKGLFNHARVFIFEVNYSDLSQGILPLMTGFWGECHLVGRRYTTTFRSLTQALQNTQGDRYSSTCRAQLGDTRCKVDLSLFKNQADIPMTCDKQLSTCRDTFHNVINFRGEPFVPGIDRLLQV